jgi:hypothetical protein
VTVDLKGLHFGLNIFSSRNMKFCVLFHMNYWKCFFFCFFFCFAVPESQQAGSQPSSNTEHSSVTIDNIPGIRGQMVSNLERPSLEGFRAAHFGPRVPAKLTGR